MIRSFCRSLIVAPLFLVGMAGAAGYSIYEQGGAATGEASAFVARASDPSAIFFNPAGIASQDAGLAIGTTFITMTSEFDGDNPFPGIGTHEEMESQVFYPTHIYLVYPVGPVTAGFGFFTPFGLGTKWGDDFSGRAISKQADIQSFYLNPTVAWRHGKFAVGGGLQAVHSKVTLVRTARLPIASASSVTVMDVATLDLEGDNGGFEWGYNVGAQYFVNDMITVGASFRSKVETALTGTAKFVDRSPLVEGQLPTEADVAADIPFPSIAAVGIAVQATPKLTIEANVVQMSWSVFDSLGIEFTEATWAPLSETIPELYEDSRSYRIGAEYQYDEQLALRCGYILDESPLPAESVSTLLPGADRYSLQAGVGYTMGDITIDASYMYLKFNDRSTQRSSSSGFDGLYKTTAHLYGITLGYSF